MDFYLIGFVPKLRSKGLHIRVSILVKQTPSKGQGHSSEGSFRGVAYVLGRCSRDWHFGYTLEVLKSLTLATVPTAHTNSHIAPDLLRRATCRIPPIVVYYVSASNISSNASISISLYSPCSVITQRTSSAISLNQGIGIEQPHLSGPI